MSNAIPEKKPEIEPLTEIEYMFCSHCKGKMATIEYDSYQTWHDNDSYAVCHEYTLWKCESCGGMFEEDRGSYYC